MLIMHEFWRAVYLVAGIIFLLEIPLAYEANALIALACFLTGGTLILRAKSGDV